MIDYHGDKFNSIGVMLFERVSAKFRFVRRPH